MTETYRLARDNGLVNNCPACGHVTTFPQTGEIRCQNCSNEYTHAHAAWVETPRHERFWGLYLDG